MYSAPRPSDGFVSWLFGGPVPLHGATGEVVGYYDHQAARAGLEITGHAADLAQNVYTPDVPVGLLEHIAPGAAAACVGAVFLDGEGQADWVTLHEASPPLLMMKEGWRTSCPICGGDDSAIYGGVFFADPAVLGRKVVVNGYGLFVGKEEAEARGLKTPAGAYKPLRVQYRPEWVSKMRWREPPVYASPG